jgi:hypothetical protein
MKKPVLIQPKLRIFEDFSDRTESIRKRLKVDKERITIKTERVVREMELNANRSSMKIESNTEKTENPIPTHPMIALDKYFRNIR